MTSLLTSPTVLGGRLRLLRLLEERGEGGRRPRQENPSTVEDSERFDADPDPTFILM